MTLVATTKSDAMSPCSSRKQPQERRIDELFARLNPGDRLLVTELSRLGRSTGQVIHLIDELVKQGIGIVVIKQNLVVSLDTVGKIIAKRC